PPMLQVQWATPQRCVEQWQSAGQAPGPGPFSAESSDPYCFPATPMQRGIWFAQQLAGDKALYAGAVLLHFSGVLDPARLQQALQCLYAELPLLRARFRLDVATRRLMVDCPENRAGVPVMAVHRLP